MPKQTTYHVIKDPVHGTMQFTTAEDSWITPFIDSPSFQRLRHIKQLGMGDYVFPGAVHTRFNHCLGCCYVASQISYKIGLEEEDRQLVIIAALLHDIGHGPFSHTFEDIFHEKMIRHEAWTPFFLAEFRTPQFFAHYNKLNPEFPLNDEKFQLIEDIIMHRPTKKGVLADIVSSQLDADRLDYLLRDNHFCGVKYGEFDFRWMLHCLAIVPSSNGERLGITYKGIGVVEHYLMARRLMLRNVSFHPKKLAIEYYLIQLLTRVAENLETYPAFAELKSTRLGQFLMRANTFNETIKHSKNIDPDKNTFLQNNYEGYKELVDYDIFMLVHHLARMKDHHVSIQLAKRIENRILPHIIRIDYANLRHAEKTLAEFLDANKMDFEEWQIAIIKSPHQSYTKEDPILVKDEQGHIRAISETSFIINAISNIAENTVYLCIDMDVSTDKRIQKLVAQINKPHPPMQS